MPEPSLDDLAIFLRVVDRAGFAGAARELRVPTSTVSRAVARLESAAGARLLQRTTRAVRPTTEGQELYAAVASSIATLHGAVRSLEPAARKPQGRLRVTAPTDLASGFLPDLLVAFSERYPQVSLDFVLTNQHANLVDGGFDVALRATAKLEDSSLVARKLGTIEQRLYASPRYLQTRGTPRTCKDLEQHACVVFRARELARSWSLRGPSGTVDISVRGAIGGDDFTFVRAMVLAGAGIALLPHVNAAGDEAAGRLVRVLPDMHARGASLYLVYPSARNVPPRVTAFRDFLVERLAPRGGQGD